MRTFVPFLCVFLVGCAASENGSTFRSELNYFFPGDSRDSKNVREWFLQVVARPSGYGDFGSALTGDPAALHRYLLRASVTTDLDGERGEEYADRVLMLLIRLGDHAFAHALRDLSRSEREALALHLEGHICHKRNWFPETRSTYEYRYPERT